MPEDQELEEEVITGSMNTKRSSRMSGRQKSFEERSEDPNCCKENTKLPNSYLWTPGPEAYTLPGATAGSGETTSSPSTSGGPTVTSLSIGQAARGSGDQGKDSVKFRTYTLCAQPGQTDAAYRCTLAERPAALLGVGEGRRSEAGENTLQ